MAVFNVTMMVRLEVADVEDPEETAQFIRDEIDIGPYEGMKILEDGDIGKTTDYQYKVEHVDDT